MTTKRPIKRPKKVASDRRDVWSEYERRKALIAERATSQADYDAQISALIDELKI